MKISVYDTYVPKDENTVMHFDILVEDKDTIKTYTSMEKKEFLISN